MYHDYFDEADSSALRNPYGPEIPLLPADRGSTRPRLLLLGMVGAGLVVVPAGGAAAAGHVPAPGAAGASVTTQPPPTG